MSDYPLPPGMPGLVTIDLVQLAANWGSLRDVVAPAECAAVVKADAYGLGAARVVPALAEAGCRTFFVALLEEALLVRRLAPEARVFVLDGLMPGAGVELAEAGVIPVLSSLPEVREWSGLAARLQRRLPAALHLDSGLNRLGMPRPDVAQLAREPGLLAPLHLALVMSHLACADDPASPVNTAQLAAFEERRKLLPAAPSSLAASDGLMLGPAYRFDLVRPGYALYGGQAFGGGPTPVRPVVRVLARVLQVHDVPAGETVGYSATWSAPTARRIATIAAGYADGVTRGLSAATGETGGFVAVDGALAPIVGRVSMDLVTVDVTDLKGRAPSRGDLVEIIGPTISIEAQGRQGRTIGYEVLTRLGRRFHRVYTGGGGA